MADEITITHRVQVENGNYKRTFNPGSIKVTQDSIGAHSTVVSVAAGTEEDMPTGDIGTEGVLVLQNLDTGKWVEWGPSTGSTAYRIGRIEPGETVMFRMKPTATLRWEASTSTTTDVLVEMWLLED